MGRRRAITTDRGQRTGPASRPAVPGREAGAAQPGGAVPRPTRGSAWWPGSTRWGGGRGPDRCRWGWWSFRRGSRAPKGLCDSKLLTEEQREALFPGHRWCAGWAVGHAGAVECDRLGMTAALRLAARRALSGLRLAGPCGGDGRRPRLRERAVRHRAVPASPPTGARRRSGRWSGVTPPACRWPPPRSWPRSPATA